MRRPEDAASQHPPFRWFLRLFSAWLEMKSKYALSSVMSKVLSKELLKQEMTRQQVMQRVEGFNKDEPRDTKVQEKVVQPEQEQIQHERREQKLRPVETREPASLQQGARQELSRDQAEEEHSQLHKTSWQCHQMFRRCSFVLCRAPS